MSAAEVIETIKNLPPEEKAQVIDFVLRYRADKAKGDLKYLSDEKFQRAKAEVFKKHDNLLRRLAQ